MDIPSWINRLDARIRGIYEQKATMSFLKPKDDGRDSGLVSAEEDAEEVLQDPEGYYTIGIPFEWFFRYHKAYFVHCTLNDETACARDRFIQTAAYAYLYLFSEYRLRKIAITSIQMDSLSYFLSFPLTAGWEPEVRQVTGWVMDDLLRDDDEQMRFVERIGVGTWQMTWFLYRILADHYGYDLEDRYYPTLAESPPVEWPHYQETIAHWDSEDLTWVDKQVSILCDILVLDNAAGEGPGDPVYETIARGPSLYPDHVLAWLRLRALKGLKNPERYSHPIMNMPLASTPLNFELPLPYPEQVAYAPELLAKLREQVPEAPLPEWVGTRKN